MSFVFARIRGHKMKNLSGSVILVTGGTGSFGNRVASHC